MTDNLEISQADRYRGLALEAYVAANLVENLDEKLVLQQIALAYDSLAWRIEQQTLAQRTRKA